MELLREFWPHLAAALTLIACILSAVHVVLYKRDARAAIAWVALIWLAPVFGSVFYFLFEINRIQRKAVTLGIPKPEQNPDPHPTPAAPEAQLPSDAAHLANLARLMERVLRRKLVPGNRVRALQNGDEAYPAMIAAIQSARRSVALSTYIFDGDRSGMEFVEALSQAAARGVAVHVLIDAVGARYSWPGVASPLRKAGCRVEYFLPTSLTRLPFFNLPFLNLRNHRKILVVDGRIGFAGGLNIREEHRLERQPRFPVQDLHFEIEGPVLLHLMEAFESDWKFCTRRGVDWGELPGQKTAGAVFARGIPAGPDMDFEKLRWTLQGAIRSARKEIRIVTPYFVPDGSLITALNAAALSGVRVEIALPERGNLRLPHWASRALLWQLLERGCKIWLTPAPFDHTKLMTVDGAWTLLGSGNWDARSLRLNFEFNVECYDAALATFMNRLIDGKLADAREVTLEQMDRRPLPERLRDGIARLLTPYL